MASDFVKELFTRRIAALWWPAIVRTWYCSLHSENMTMALHVCGHRM